MDTLINQILAIITQTICELKQIISAKPEYDWWPLGIQVFISLVLLITAFIISRQLYTQNKMLKTQLLKDRITMGWSTDEPITEEFINNVKFLPECFISKKYKNIYMNNNSVSKSSFNHLDLDLEKIWKDLINNKHIEQDGRISDTSLKIKELSKFKIHQDFQDKKSEIFTIFQQKKINRDKIGKYLYLSKVYNYFLYVYTSSKKTKDPLGDDWQGKWLREIKKDEVFADVRGFHENGHPDFEEHLKKLMEGPVIEEDLVEVGCDETALFQELVNKKIIDKKRFVKGDIDSLNPGFMNLNTNQLDHVKYILLQSKMNRWRTFLFKKNEVTKLIWLKIKLSTHSF